MDIYIEYARLFNALKTLKLCERTYGKTKKLNIHLFINKSITLFSILFMIRINKAIASLELWISEDKLSKFLVKLINSNAKIGVVVTVKRKLSVQQFKRLSTIKGIIRVIDYTKNDENNKFYQSNRYVIYNDKNKVGIRDADIYNMISKENPMYQCCFSSCLGKTLYISDAGDISFCPFNAKQSKIGTLTNINNAFENELFVKTLEQNIGKRNICKTSCEFFFKCKGGCPMEDSCLRFPEKYQDAKLNLEGIEMKKEKLSDLPFYKEYALLNKLLTKVRK